MIETDLSDFHKMLVATMKMHFPKIKPRVNRYRKYKTFSNDAFVKSLRKEITRQKRFQVIRGLTHFEKFVQKFVIKTPL